MEHLHKTLIVIMGVCGSGKSTLGKAIASSLQIPFIEGDDYHPPSNVDKMSRGIPLNDADRSDWLIALHNKALEHADSGAVIACSALKESYRKQLCAGLEDRFLWILLEGSYEVILARMQARKAHFMPAALIQSQFDTLEIPGYAFRIDIELSTDEQERVALNWIKKKAADKGAS